MARPLRLEVPGGFYHVMARGNAKDVIFVDDVDRQHFLIGLSRVVTRLDWALLAYCLMANHYHLLVNTPEATLGRGMRDVNGAYAQRFNRRQGRVGHVFQGRYKALLVEEGSYLLEVIRYIARNPVSAGLCATPDEWAWSSHRAIVGLSSPPPGLAISGMLKHFGTDAEDARRRYATFVGVDGTVTGDGWLHPVIAGSDSFASRAVQLQGRQSIEVPRRHRITCSISDYERRAEDRNEAIKLAYASGAHSLSEIARHFGLHYSTVSRVCRTSETTKSATDSLDTVRQFKT